MHTGQILPAYCAGLSLIGLVARVLFRDNDPPSDNSSIQREEPADSRLPPTRECIMQVHLLTVYLKAGAPLLIFQHAVKLCNWDFNAEVSENVENV